MAHDTELVLIFVSGIMRFDASGNLFVHLSHGRDLPHRMVVDGTDARKIPGAERRAFVQGSGSMKVAGSWPRETTELLRGLLVDLKGYESAEITDGVLTVRFSSPPTLPSWMVAGGEHRFERDGDQLRMWDKSQRPKLVGGTKTPKKTGKQTTATKKKSPANEKAAVKKKAAAKKAPAKKSPGTKKAPTKKRAVANKKTTTDKRSAAEEAPAPEAQAAAPPSPAAAAEPSSRPNPDPQSDPFRPGRLSEGSYTATRGGGSSTSRVGCSTLAVLSWVVCGLLGAAVF